MKAGFKKKEKGLSGGKRIAVKVVTIALSVLALFLTFVYLNNADRAARDTVAVVRLRRGTPAYTLLTKDDIVKYDLIRKEFNEKDMILFENAEDEVLGKYTSYFIRGESVLHKDQLTEERTIRNEWLYTLSQDEEVVTIPYRYAEAGGELLLPGDLIRIRVTYEGEVPVSDTNPYDYGFNPNYQGGSSGTTKTTITEILFDSVVVKDMINSNGRSVYELYKEVMRLDERQRESVMASKAFISSTRPTALLLAGTSQDMEDYAKFRATVSSSNFLITILSRTGSVNDFDSLPILETEVRSWIDGGN
ncbi:MAG: flagellar biosynthesis protein FlgA [Defluviitaleaceae bacterium]|nr:flagellar biosynthesis protein FlgA [Defluviitaleaceae bacterium]